MRGGTFILQLKNILALRDAELKRFRMMAILSFLAELFIAGQKATYYIIPVQFVTLLACSDFHTRLCSSLTFLSLWKITDYL